MRQPCSAEQAHRFSGLAAAACGEPVVAQPVSGHTHRHLGFVFLPVPELSYSVLTLTKARSEGGSLSISSGGTSAGEIGAGPLAFSAAKPFGPSRN